jgi:hypothetical protein
MDVAAKATRLLLETLTQETKVDEAFLKFVRQLEIDYEEKQDIAAFIFAIRAFFGWRRAPELCEKANQIHKIWVDENDATYTAWLVSANDDQDILKWSKWTFQAKTSLLNRFIKNPDNA